MNFVVVRSPSPYNEIIGRPGVRKLHAVTAYGMLKLPVEGGVITLKRSRLVTLECALVSGSEGTLSAIKPTVEERIKVAINPEYPEQIVMIGSTLMEEGRNKLQKKMGQAADRNQAIQEERMCVYFKDLNKAYSKDGYPLPEIDWKVESLCGFPFKCFLDAYKGYHHIKMAKEDEEKIAFITSQGIFCYTKMPFGLRNAGATYQHLVDKAFYKQIGRNHEVYVDDLVIKSRTEDEIVRDMEETFQTLREINMKLNPKKCNFRIEEGMFLGYKVSTRGLKKSDFYWIAKAEEAFKQMKQLIVELPMLVALIEKEELIVYLAAAKETGIKGSENKLHIDGRVSVGPGACQSSCINGIGAGLILTNPEGIEFTYALRFRFDATNNESEYEALIVGLKTTEQMGVKNLQENVDSRLVANQVNGTYVAKETDMIRYLEKVNTLTNSFKALSIKQELKEKSISAMEVLAIVEEEGDTWMTHIFKYLTDGTLPAEDARRHMIRCGKSLADWLLLANHARGCKNANKSMPRLSSSQTCSKESTAKARPNLISVTDNPFKDWCEKLCICQHFASVKHPQTNGLVERANCSLREVIKARLDERSKIWMEELPHVLWAHRTMIKYSNGDTPFSLTYRTEAVILAEIGMPTLRTAEVDLAQNNEALEINVDLLEERREQAAIREAKSKAKMEKYYNSEVRSTSFKPGDLVYHNNEVIHAEDTRKLGSKWEGPYEVTEALGKGHTS
ncbi:reverse transcriptase domain-containing protein [Tanacetum coccineum]|uniref:Reverse transcriptase domain-containing protein n=1 Tax=Tanacetum coccineum TaxID=301880 RepID=A0ABQ5BNB3_9ASTR